MPGRRHEVIRQEDFQGRNCYLQNSTRENYGLQGAKHIAGDKAVSWQEIKSIKREIEGHCKALANV